VAKPSSRAATRSQPRGAPQPRGRTLPRWVSSSQRKAGQMNRQRFGVDHGEVVPTRDCVNPCAPGPHHLRLDYGTSLLFEREGCHGQDPVDRHGATVSDRTVLRGSTEPTAGHSPRTHGRAPSQTRRRRSQSSGLHLAAGTAASQLQLPTEDLEPSSRARRSCPRPPNPRHRHTCASLLSAQGAHPKAAQVHLWHSSISVTMDRYGHLFPSDMQALAMALDGMRVQALADYTRAKSGSEVLELFTR